MTDSFPSVHFCASRLRFWTYALPTSGWVVIYFFRFGGSAFCVSPVFVRTRLENFLLSLRRSQLYVFAFALFSLALPCPKWCIVSKFSIEWELTPLWVFYPFSAGLRCRKNKINEVTAVSKQNGKLVVASSARDDGYLCEPDYGVTGIFVSPVMKWRVSLWSRLWNDGYICKPDHKVAVIFLSSTMKWRVSLWSRLWNDGYLCEPDYEATGIFMSPIIKWRVSSGARSCRSVGYLCKPDYEVTGIFLSLIRKWRVSLWARLCGSVGYLCKPDSEVTGVFASPIMRWRVSLWARLWSDGYLCEPDFEVTGIFVSPTL